MPKTTGGRGAYTGEGAKRLARGGSANVATNGLADLAAAMERQTAADGGYETAGPGLTLFRFSAPSDPPVVVSEPALCVVAQGAKEVLLGDETYRYDPAHSLLVSVDLPVA